MSTSTFAKAVAAALAPAAVAVAGPTNYVHLEATRINDLPFGTTGFYTMIEVNVPGVAGVTGVNVVMPGSVAVQLFDEGDGRWAGELDHDNLDELKSAVTGAWSIVIDNGLPNLTTFSVNATPLVEGDFYATPAVTNPSHGDTGVPLDVIFAWEDPTGQDEADALVVSVEDGPETQGQEANNILGEIDVADTSWKPPAELLPGYHEFSVMYLDLVDPGAVSPLAVAFGAIIWGDSPFAPEGYPPGTPLVVIGSETIIGFDAAAPPPPCPADVDGTGVVDVDDLVAVILDWGTDGSAHNSDVDGSGTVDVDDIVVVILTWGPCD
ncbi:MAG: hypothetical protein ACYTJ0_02055 [Planctomycetota bacterium]|jgi:hypothetical protein